MNTEKTTKGYKVTDSEMKCRDFQFELNKRYEETGKLKICKNGFHFCEKASDCFNYYTFTSENRVFEVIAYGDLDTEGDKNACLTIELIKELTWLEVLNLVNSGKDNIGINNTGIRNTGSRNTGIRNTGNWNTGIRNTGNWNTGSRNTGDSNTGNWNTGSSNTGNWNTGDSNTGNWNTGSRNTGDRNTGNWNTGNWNTGDSNTGNWNTGAFCTNNNPKVLLFDSETEMTVLEWEKHDAFNIMANYLNPNIWIWESEMSEDDKMKHPSYSTTGGCLKSIPMHEAWSNMWHNLTDKKREVFLSLPNFNSVKFLEITGINISETKE